MKTALLSVTILAGLIASSSVSVGADRAHPLGDPQLERPALHSVGVYWIVGGDDNRNATVRLEYRKADASSCGGCALDRVERKAHLMERLGSRLAVPDLRAKSAGLPGASVPPFLSITEPAAASRAPDCGRRSRRAGA